ncbi:MAG: hypothetical protein PHR51_01820 [Patescibacteria group bacterium]|nr:hypothetical protein [Patescibacteria group bacterium]
MADKQDRGKELFSWQAGEFRAATRGVWWHVTVWALAILAVVYSVYIQSWFFIGVVVMIVVALYVLGRAEPRVFTHSITDSGILVGERFYSYDSLKSFWIVNDKIAGVTLNVMTAKRFDLLLTLQIQESDVEKVRQILSKFLPEDAGRGEDTIDKIGRFLKF